VGQLFTVLFFKPYELRDQLGPFIFLVMVEINPASPV
jgi:hypothetical protein